MVTTATHADRAERRFRLFKYTVYALLTINIAVFFREEWLAVGHVFASGVRFDQLIEAFASTIDTANWVVLLLLFELETSVLPDERLRGRTKWLLHGARLACYALVVYAFYGYLVKAFGLYAYTPADIASLCERADGGHAMLIDLDEFETITVANCAQAAGAALLMLPGTAVYATEAIWQAAVRLAWTDVLNAGAWILVVIVLEIDVRLQLAGRLGGGVRRLSQAFKALLYATLVACATYWGFAGDFIDFWDAFLWILAFVAIELNVFQWQAETGATGVPQPAG